MNQPSSSFAVLGASQVENPAVTATSHIDRREWWLWCTAIAINLLLTAGIAAAAIPAVLRTSAPFLSLFADRYVRALWALVLLFDGYAIYEQIQIHRIRHQFADRLYTLAVMDPLTGLFNRRYIEHRLDEEVARCGRQGTPLTVMVFDLDGFKQVNDEYGHPAGDVVLKVFADRLKRATRGSDVAARYGGDEFLVLLTDCGSEGLQFVLRRLNGTCGKPDAAAPIGYSFGWADYRSEESVQEFLKRADSVLYANKLRPKRGALAHSSK